MGLVVYWYDVVCFIIVGASIVVSVYVLWRKEGTQGQISSSQLWTTCWRGLHPAWLLVFRLLSLLLLTAFLSLDILQWGGSIFIYYTEWTFSLVIMYFLIGSVVSGHGCWLLYTDRACIQEKVAKDVEECTALLTSKKNEINVQFNTHFYQNLVLKRSGFWGYLMQTAYQTCGGAVVLTDVVFWCIIVPFMLNSSHLELDLLMGCMHTLNLVSLLIDTCVNRLPFSGFRIAYFVIWSCIYVIFQWIIHLCGFSWWPYPFLELSTPWAPLWYLALAIAHIACYGFYTMIINLKNALFSKFFPHSYLM